MPRAVRFEEYGGPEVLRIVEVPKPEPGTGEVVVRVVSSAVNPGEDAIRSGAMREQFPAHFPEGEGSDLAGVIDAVGDGVEDVEVGMAVIGFSDGRNAHADFVLLPAERVIPKPAGLVWSVAGSLYVAGTTAVAMMDATTPGAGDTVVVSGAAGGVGSIVIQLAARAGARVFGVAAEANHDALRDLGAEPVTYGDGLEERLRALAPNGVDALLDTHGGGYLDLGQALGVPRERTTTIADFAGAERLGVQPTGMSTLTDPRAAVAALAQLAAEDELVVPIRARYRLDEVADAYRDLSSGHGLGKVVLEVGSA